MEQKYSMYYLIGYEAGLGSTPAQDNVFPIWDPDFCYKKIEWIKGYERAVLEESIRRAIEPLDI